jgi:hypothetical protein
MFVILVQVFFKPKISGVYHCRFRFQVSCGEDIDIELFGVGTYDEQYVVHRQGHK